MPAAPFESPPPAEVGAYDIKWVGSPHRTAGRGGRQPIAIVLHTMGGYLAGTDAWFNNPAAEVSTHFGIGLGGDVHQYVALDDTAWGNGVLEAGATWPGPAGVNPNLLTVSIETEDNRSNLTPVSDALYASTLATCRHIMRGWASIRYLVTHRCISPRSRVHCPGDRWIASGRFAAIGAALGLETIE